MKKETVKSIARFVGSFAVGGLTSLLVKQNVLPKNMYEKIIVAVGSFVLSDMVSVKAEDHIDAQIDSIYATLENYHELNKPMKKTYSQTKDEEE